MVLDIPLHLIYIFLHFSATLLSFSHLVDTFDADNVSSIWSSDICPDKCIVHILVVNDHMGVDIGRCSGSLSISLLHLKSGIDSSPLYITVDPSDYMSLCSIIIYPVLCMLAHYPAVKVRWDAWKDRAIVSNTCPVPVMTGPSVSSEY